METKARTVKPCRTCGKPRTSKRWTKSPTKTQWYKCSFCTQKSQQRWEKKNIEKRRAITLKSQRKSRRKYLLEYCYGITEDDYSALFEEQNGLCAACGGPPDRPSFCVDHNHETKEVRGLLCNRCNLALGNLKEDPEKMRKLIIYIESYKK